MKKYKILIISCFLASLFSCDDFLNVETPSSFDADYVFSNSDDAKKAVLGVYALFSQDTYTSRMSNVWMQNTDVEVTAPGSASDGSRRDIWSLEASGLTGFSDIYKAWQDNYLAIDRANQCIEGIQKSGAANEPEMKMLLGESYCLRAYRYFLLCNFWGDVPYFRESAKAGMEFDIPKVDKNIIYSGMMQDLVNIEEDMYFADAYGDGIERMNREFALGMIARLAMFRAGYGMTKEGVMKRADDYLDVTGDENLAVKYIVNGSEKVARTSQEYYQLAKDYCQKLISLKDRTLNPDFAGIFRNQCEWKKTVNDDILYEVAFGNTNGGGDVGWCIGVTVSSSSKGSTTIQVGLSPTYYFSFDQKDTRRDATISKISYASDTEQKVAGPTSLSVGKWNRLWMTYDSGSGSSKSTGINWPLMRYSDVLLMLAEADNEINGSPTTLAKEMLSRVRKRAFPAEVHNEKITAYINKLTSKEDFFNAIVNERAWEFGGECLRKFDLIRWNKYGEKIVETKKMLDNIGKAAYQLDLTNPEVLQYANYAPVLYYQKKGGKITFLNDFYSSDVIPDKIVPAEDLEKPENEGAYASLNWAKDLYKKVENKDTKEVTYESADYTTRCWRGYKDASGLSAVPYLVPISTQTIETSVHLNNDGYGF